MHSINLYIFKEPATPVAYPHVAENGYVLMPVTEKFLKAASISHNDDDYNDKVVQYLLDNFSDLVWAETDYFGGPGEQDAKAWVNKINVQKHGSINEALRLIGVVREGAKDEFDTIHLGSYRTNEDVEDEWKDIHGKVVEKDIIRAILRRIPAQIELLSTEERLYKSANSYVVKITQQWMKKEEEAMYYSAVSEKQNLISDPGFLHFKETRTRATKADFELVAAKPFSKISLQMANDGDSYTFMKAVTEDSTICIVDIRCSETGEIALHDNVKNEIIVCVNDYSFDPCTIGLTGNPQYVSNLKPIKKVLYECPICSNALHKHHVEATSTNGQDSMYKCSKCDYKTYTT